MVLFLTSKSIYVETVRPCVVVAAIGVVVVEQEVKQCNIKLFSSELSHYNTSKV